MSDLSEYYTELPSHRQQDRKSATVRYYTLCCRLDGHISELDELTEELSREIFASDQDNRYDICSILSACFENALAVRKTIEEFLTESEHLVKQEENDFAYSLKRQTDIAIKKIALLIKSA